MHANTMEQPTEFETQWVPWLELEGWTVVKALIPQSATGRISYGKVRKDL